jgi:putative colanic acid biosynthesis glycosyltransferase
MKIAIIDVNYSKSSTGKIVKDLKSNFESRGNDVLACFGRGEPIVEASVVKISNDIETFIHAGLTRLTGYTGGFSYFSTKKLITQLERFKPDVVHLHELHGYYVDLYEIIDWLIQSNIPVIWTFHCEFMYTGKCGYAYDCNKWKTGCGKCPSLKEYPASYTDKTASMYIKKKEIFKNFFNLKIVTPSDWLLGRVKDSFLGDKYSTVIYNGIDTKDVFYPRISIPSKLQEIDLSKPTVLSVAPNILEERKGGEWVIKLAQRFSSNFNFILVGVNDFSRKYPNNVYCFARTSDQSELAEFYSVADLFLICSKRENFPTTCLESLACGTPIIGFDEGGTSETAPAPHGKFVEYGNLDKLENVIRSHFDKLDMLADAESCRNFAVRNYAKEVMAENYLKLYLESIG